MTPLYPTTPKQAAAIQTRERLLDAAVDTLLLQGVLKTTLDTVAKQAGVSKGGLLHHFPSKEALVEAVLRRLMRDFEQQVHAYYAQEQGSSGRWLRAYIRATFADNPLPLELIWMLLTALVDNPVFQHIVQADFNMWQARLLHDGIPAARAHIIRLACDAYWMERVIEEIPKTPEERSAIQLELLALTTL